MNEELLKLIKPINKLAKIYFIRQQEPKGLGHAVGIAKEFVKNEPFAVLLGDDIFYHEEKNCLKSLIDEYENKIFPIEAPDPIVAIKIRMEELNLKQVDLVEIIGGKSRVSEILNRKRKLTLEMIRNLNQKLNLSPAILISDYQLLK